MKNLIRDYLDSILSKIFFSIFKRIIIRQIKKRNARSTLYKKRYQESFTRIWIITNGDGIE